MKITKLELEIMTIFPKANTQKYIIKQSNLDNVNNIRTTKQA